MGEQYKFLCDEQIKKSADALWDRYGVTLTKGTERLLEWYIAQTPEVQRAIIERGNVAAMLAQQHAAGGGGENLASIEQAAKVAHQAISRLQVMGTAMEVQAARLQQLHARKTKEKGA